jgi:PhzF family phenazine biosynthesis protein
MQRRFRQVDVFTTEAYRGNPVAVVLDAEDVSPEDMLRVANWTNLSETTFVLPPTVPEADYAVRIFTPTVELPFAGHPTLGTAHAWLAEGGVVRPNGVVVQECGVGLVTIRRTDAGLAFAAPPLVRSGPVEPDVGGRVLDALGIEAADIVDMAWADNGPGWIAVLLPTVEAVLGVRPRPSDLDIGVAALHDAGSAVALEVRGFFPKDGVLAEDPVTGSLNASLAQWLIGSGRLPGSYVAAQGTALGRAGRIHVGQDDAGAIWIGGGTVTCVSGEITI